MQEEANATQILLRTRNIDEQKVRVSNTQKETTNYFEATFKVYHNTFLYIIGVVLKFILIFVKINTICVHYSLWKNLIFYFRPPLPPKKPWSICYQTCIRHLCCSMNPKFYFYYIYVDDTEVAILNWINNKIFRLHVYDYETKFKRLSCL